MENKPNLILFLWLSQPNYTGINRALINWMMVLQTHQLFDYENSNFQNNQLHNIMKTFLHKNLWTAMSNLIPASPDTLLRTRCCCYDDKPWGLFFFFPCLRKCLRKRVNYKNLISLCLTMYLDCKAEFWLLWLLGFLHQDFHPKIYARLISAVLRWKCSIILHQWLANY